MALRLSQAPAVGKWEAAVEERDRGWEAEFFNLPWQERSQALRLWKFWGEGDADLARLMDRVTGQGVMSIQPDDLARVYVAMLRGEGRRATAARAALKGLQGLVDGGKDAQLKELKKAAQEALTERRLLRERAEKAEAESERWAVRWERELAKARDEGREQARKEQEKEARKEAELQRRVAQGLRDVGTGGV